MLGFGFSLGSKHVIFKETESPCMTGYDTPYGFCEASHELTGYQAWKGFDCTNHSGSDCWLTPLIANDEISPENEEVWAGWWLTDDDIAGGMPLMVPTQIEIHPRRDMNTAWYTDHNPYRMRIKGIAADMSEFVILNEYYTDNWTGGGERIIDLTGMTETECRGIKIYILGTRAYEQGVEFHSGWGKCQFFGTYSSGMQTTDLDGDGNPDTIIYNDGTTTVSVDEDSINIDVDGDGSADIVIPTNFNGNYSS